METRRPAEVFHPGEHLLDELNARGWTQVEFADILGRPYQLVNEIINGKKGITSETARELGAALGTSAEYWMNLNIAYDLWKSNKDVSPIQHRAKMRTKYPIRDMALRNWLQPSEDTRIVESQLLRFFEVESLDEQPKYAQTAMPRRSDLDMDELTPTQIAWLYRVKHIAEAMQVPKYSEKSLREALEQLNAYRAAREEIRHIPQLLEACGVRFVIVEPLPSSKIDGVCLWLEDSSPVIGLTLRYDRIDNFWFVLRHEIEHVLNGDGKGSAILDSDLIGTLEDKDLAPQEQAANAATVEFCVPQKELDHFIARKNPYFSRKDVLNFAKSLEVHPGMVVGQLQWRIKRFDLFRSMLVTTREMITHVAMTDGYGNVIPIQI
ncbi:MAG: HigA family addiction module antitoxin [Anaerolineaceae bacterium]|nr:HigA family addiction module antitoxin [Anaerolineaceae bacterium]